MIDCPDNTQDHGVAKPGGRPRACPQAEWKGSAPETLLLGALGSVIDLAFDEV